MIYFPNMTLHRYVLGDAGKGLYGETIHDYTYADDIRVDFQNETNQEIAHEYGVDLQNLYKLYINLSVTINDTDQLRDDNSNKYHIIGNIMKYNHFHKYQVAHIVLERGDANGS